MIGAVVEPSMITPNLVVMLANALYFKGAWEEKFDLKDTKLHRYQVTSDSRSIVSKEVSMMTRNQFVMQMVETPLELQGSRSSGTEILTLRLPFKGRSHFLYLSFAADNELAGDGSESVTVDANVDVKVVYRSLIAARNLPLGHLEAKKVDAFKMPKFTIESRLNCIDRVLADAGYGTLFRDGALSQMTHNPLAY